MPEELIIDFRLDRGEFKLIREDVMSEKKPTPIIVERNISICPVCGKRSYSRGGIHPQCAMIQADAPRNLRLAAEKKAKAKERLRTLA
jgi:hypothetical protein